MGVLKSPGTDPQYWGYVLTTARARDQTRCSILNALQALEQLVGHAVQE